MSTATYHRGTGRRKCAIAQVKLSSGSGQILINGKEHTQYFPLVDHRNMVEKAFIVTETVGKYNIEVKVVGGGVTGQASAIKHGIARALVALKEEFRAPLRKHGLLTRDSRIKERKKYGLKRARKAPQYTKR
ncbi:MAG: 30S ribosomal protein S9 [Dehalococcoidia bacterium]|nr:30S ribosomal protein S9 [Dehalococcoidia bacterium]